MPLFYLRRLSGSRRTPLANRHLGQMLCFIAGAINAGGFLAIGQYTSHMTGIVSSLADNLATGNLALLGLGIGSVAAFIAGSAYSAILINWGRNHRLHSRYAYPLLWEAFLLLGFGILGGSLTDHALASLSVTVLLLCFIMGLQNAIITKVSNAEIRTTHMTGVITDIGIELGKLVYINAGPETAHRKPVHANLGRLKLLLTLLLSFFCGGAVGAFGFASIGYSTTIPLALALVLMAIVPFIDDLRLRKRVFRRYHRQKGRTPL